MDVNEIIRILSDIRSKYNCFDAEDEECYRGLSEAIKMLTAQQWIPCSEHPDTDRNVFIARGKTDLMSCCIGHYDHNAKLWYEDRNWFAKIIYDAMYWCEMPSLPEPWKGEQE